ncbi:MULTISPECIES: hypothetical protein [unclassified Imperialibacter]|uniref:hypothetical protein n=1 Tax=unclassified Imperialibacter TaxID=2629706 RepID=UPI00125F609E|nr:MULTISPECIES: hypothetical protein [unclassified Imperialibacter]
MKCIDTTSPVRDDMAVTPKARKESRASAVGTAYNRSTIIGAVSLTTTPTCIAPEKVPYQASAVAHGDFFAALRNDVVMEGLADERPL